MHIYKKTELGFEKRAPQRTAVSILIFMCIVTIIILIVFVNIVFIIIVIMIIMILLISIMMMIMAMVKKAEDGGEKGGVTKWKRGRGVCSSRPFIPSAPPVCSSRLLLQYSRFPAEGLL